MKTMPVKRSLAAALLSASALIAVAGCTAARKTSTPLAGAPEPPAKKEYQWQDMSQGKAFFGNPPTKQEN